jgi:hypothetical protein
MRALNLIMLLFLLVFASEATLAQGSESGIPDRADIAKAVSVYPNPAVDFLNIKLTTLNAHHTKLTLYNILGNEISAETEIVDDHEIRVRVKDLSTGYYLLAVRDEQTQFRGTYKFLKR